MLLLPAQVLGGAHQWRLLRVEMGLTELPRQRGSPPQPAVSLQASAAGWWTRRLCTGRTASCLGA